MSIAEKLSTPLRAAVVGARAMGKRHAQVLSKQSNYRLAAVCDLVPEIAHECAAEVGATAYTDLRELLRVERPEVVVICTNNTTHARLTIEVAQAGVRSIVCEKPMATCLGDAREMVAACEKAGVILLVNHQRRLGADLAEMRRLIDSGAIGDVIEIRGWCAGDILSDGTHLIDSLLWLSGDGEADWVAGHISRDLSSAAGWPKSETPDTKRGFRYGHAVESGGWGLIHLKDERRLEIFCGDYRGRREYQEYEVIGTHGRLWRIGDRMRPNLFIEDASGGDLEARFDEDTGYIYPQSSPNGRGPWRAVPVTPLASGGAIPEAYQRLVRCLREGIDHPMTGRNALRGLELVMAIYESARLGGRVSLPLAQEVFPLDLMIKEGRAS